MAAGSAPKQGDHVFNAVAIGILQPFETMRSLRSPGVNGQVFVPVYLPQTYGLAQQWAGSPALIASREFTASEGAEEDALREIAKLRARFPALANISASLLRTIHDQNARRFGEASRRFERELLAAVLQALEAAAGGAAMTAGPTASPGIAYQQMLAAAYDPAAALVVITTSMARESIGQQGAFCPVIAAIAETLDRPALWKEPYRGYRAHTLTPTGTLIERIRDALLRMEWLKGPGAGLSTILGAEIARNAKGPRASADCGPMLYLIHQKVQQLRA
ncbi:MAG: hypothetical protein R2762_11160 [Bryobacteraceae bacterium]